MKKILLLLCVFLVSCGYAKERFYSLPVSLSPHEDITRGQLLQIYCKLCEKEIPISIRGLSIDFNYNRESVYEEGKVYVYIPRDKSTDALPMDIVNYVKSFLHKKLSCYGDPKWAKDIRYLITNNGYDCLGL